MTQLDVLDRRLVDELVERAGTRIPEYTDEVLAAVARTRQRPAWTFVERWGSRPSAWTPATRRAWLAALIGLALLAGVAAWVGSRPAPPPIVPLAGNGLIVTGVFGDTPGPRVEGVSRIVTIDPVTRDVRPTVVGEAAAGGASDAGAPGGWFGRIAGVSPDGTRVAYFVPEAAIAGASAAEPPIAYRLFTSALDGSDAREVLSASLIDVTDASWSPDGRRMVVSFGGRPNPVVGIVEMDGSGMRILDLGMPADDARWQPNGDLILVRGWYTRPAGLYTVASNGATDPVLVAEVDPVSSATYPEPEAAWSPDGQWVAYIRGSGSADDAGFTTVHVVRLDGARHAIHIYSGVSSGPRWAPDGGALLVRNERSVGADGLAARLLLVSLDGRDTRPIGPLATAETSEALTSYAWSPDGRLVVAGPMIVAVEPPEDADEASMDVGAALISLDTNTWTYLDVEGSWIAPPGFFWQPVAP